MNAYPVPTHTVTTFTKDIDSGRYVKDATIVPEGKMPAWIKITKTFDPGRKAVGAEFMADGPTKKGKKFVHAGLIPTGLVGWYVTDIPDTYRGEVCKNTVVFYFSPDARRMVVYFFTGLQKFSIEKRVEFALQVIPSLRIPEPLPPATSQALGAADQRPAA